MPSHCHLTCGNENEAPQNPNFHKVSKIKNQQLNVSVKIFTNLVLENTQVFLYLLLGYYTEGRNKDSRGITVGRKTFKVYKCDLYNGMTPVVH